MSIDRLEAIPMRAVTMANKERRANMVEEKGRSEREQEMCRVREENFNDLGK